MGRPPYLATWRRQIQKPTRRPRSCFRLEPLLFPKPLGAAVFHAAAAHVCDAQRTFVAWTRTPQDWQCLAPQFGQAFVTTRPQRMDEREIDFAVIDLKASATTIALNAETFLRETPCIALAAGIQWGRAEDEYVPIDMLERMGWRRFATVGRFFLFRAMRRSGRT